MKIRRDLATLPLNRTLPETTEIRVERMGNEWGKGPGVLSIAWNCTFCGRRHATLDVVGEAEPPAKIFVTLDTPKKEA